MNDILAAASVVFSFNALLMIFVGTLAGDRLRQTQERLVDNTQDIVTILARCGGKEGSLVVVAS